MGFVPNPTLGGGVSLRLYVLLPFSGKIISTFGKSGNLCTFDEFFVYLRVQESNSAAGAKNTHFGTLKLIGNSKISVNGRLRRACFPDSVTLLILFDLQFGNQPSEWELYHRV